MRGYDDKKNNVSVSDRDIGLFHNPICVNLYSGDTTICLIKRAHAVIEYGVKMVLYPIWIRPKNLLLPTSGTNVYTVIPVKTEIRYLKNHLSRYNPIFLYSFPLFYSLIQLPVISAIALYTQSV